MSEKITLKSLFDEIESLRQVVNDLSKEIDIFKNKEQQTLKENKKVVIIQDEPIIIKAKKNE
jgi:regulator of replication initiation timing